MSNATQRSRIVARKPVSPRLAFRKTERALLKLSSHQDAESVHSFRTSCRRLQALLEEIIPLRGREHRKLLKMLGRIRKRAGKLRDLDVQLNALRSLHTPQEPRRRTQLVHSLIDLRAKHEKKLRKLLSKETIREIRQRLRRGAKDLKKETSRDPLTVARAMLSKVDRPAGPVTEEWLHRYRMTVKRARYVAEFGGQSSATRRFISELKRLQDALGNWHDWLTLTETAAEQIGDINESSLVAALHNVTGGKFRHAVAALSSAAVIPPAEKQGVGAEPSRKQSRHTAVRAEGTATAA